AAIVVDGRYLVQVREEVDSAAFAVEHLIEHPPTAWIEENLPSGAKLGYSPWLHTVDGVERLAKAADAAGGSLVAVADNPIDGLWQKRPQPPLGAAVLHDLRYAGEDAAAKLGRVKEALGQRADALIVSDPQAVSWLFNIRGSDVPHVPAVLPFATVPRSGRPAIYVEPGKLTGAARAQLEALAAVRAPADFEKDLATLGKARAAAMLDPALCPDAIARAVTESGGKIVRAADP